MMEDKLTMIAELLHGLPLILPSVSRSVTCVNTAYILYLATATYARSIKPPTRMAGARSGAADRWEGRVVVDADDMRDRVSPLWLNPYHLPPRSSEYHYASHHRLLTYCRTSIPA